MADRTSQDIFWALTIAGIVYLVMMTFGIEGFIGIMIAGSAFSWALKGEKDEKDDAVESMIRPPRDWESLLRSKNTTSITISDEESRRSQE